MQTRAGATADDCHLRDTVASSSSRMFWPRGCCGRLRRHRRADHGPRAGGGRSVRAWAWRSHAAEAMVPVHPSLAMSRRASRWLGMGVWRWSFRKVIAG